MQHHPTSLGSTNFPIAGRVGKIVLQFWGCFFSSAWIIKPLVSPIMLSFLGVVAFNLMSSLPNLSSLELTSVVYTNLVGTGLLTPAGAEHILMDLF